MIKFQPIWALFPLLLSLTACDTGSTPPATKAPLEKAAPQAVAAKPVVINPALAAQGKTLYGQNCVFCHQADAIGKPGFAP